MKKVANLLMFLILGTAMYAQLPREIFPFSREYFKGGLYVSPLATISFGNSVDGSFSNMDSTYSFENTGRGKWGYGLEVGWFQTFDNLYVIDYLEGGVSYRRFSGAAEHEGVLEIGQTPVTAFDSDNDFTYQVLSGAIRAMGETQTNSRQFITYGIGANYYYRFSNDYERSSNYPNNYEEFQAKSTVQAHLKLGYGFKVSDNVLLIPTVESPFLTVYPTDDLDPRLTFFNVKYQPLIIGLQFMFMRKNPVNCNAPQLRDAPSVK